MRLIDADTIFNNKMLVVRTECYDAVRAVIERINNAPTVDPYKHGHWIEHDVGLICSECNHYTEAMYDEPFNNEFGKGWALKRPYYCGYCGAKMKEDELEEPEINPCRGCVDYDGRGGCKSNGGCGAEMDEVME